MKIARGSLWVAYTALNTGRLQSYLPAHLQLTSSPLFADSSDRQPKLLFNAYSVESQWMRGHRIDVQVLARHRNRGTLHLVVLDCLSDTLLWDPEQGVRMPNSGRALLRASTLKYKFEMRAKHTQTSLLAVEGLKSFTPTKIGKRFAVDANRACYFGTYPSAFRLHFNESSIAQPVRRLVDAHVCNSLWRNWRCEAPSHVFIHDHPMDFDVDVKGHSYSFKWPSHVGD